KSTVKIVTSDTDFKSNYYSVNPTLYNVIVCEHCGLAFTEDFSNYFPPGTQETLQRSISDHWTKQSSNDECSLYQAIKSYQLAIFCGEIKKEKHVVLAGLALRTAWLYREQEKFDWEMRFLESARDEYIECYLHGDYRGTPMTEIRVLYLI